MHTRFTNKLFIFVALWLALSVMLIANTTALAKGPKPLSAQDRIELGNKVNDPNAPANLAKIVASDVPVRVVIQFTDPPAAKYRGGIKGVAAVAMTEDGKLDVEAAATQSYVTRLAQAQDKFASALTTQVSSAKVQYKYQLALNGLTAQVPGKAIPALKKMAGVKSVTVALRHYQTMDASLPLIGLYNGFIGTGTDTGIWKQLGGHSKAGKGIKIADIDTGIDQTHPFFSVTGFQYPRGFPKGDAAYTTRKVIVARAYFRPDAPPDTSVDCACPKDYIGHGTHTAGTMAGRFGAATPYGVNISGIAPMAWLMNYKIFYTNIVDGGDYSETPEELKAIEDVIRDGADVVNNSWGGTAVDYETDPAIQAFNAAVDAGIVVVFSAGNNGPSSNTIGSPGTGDKFITVGASTTNRVFALPVTVTAPASVDPALSNLAGAASSGPNVTTTIGPAPFISAGAVGDEQGCSAFPAGAFDGAIALIKRGTCTFSDKVGNATDAGAIAVVVWNNVSGPPVSMLGLEGTTIPSVMVDNTDGNALKNWYAANPGTAQLQIGATMSRLTKATWQDLIASFSSRGPNVNLSIKPDLVAPGVNILSSVPYGNRYDVYQGTSMAAPHVTGVAALVKQLHKNWTPAQIKSAIMNTTQLPTSLDPSCKDAVGNSVPGPMCRGAGRLWAGTGTVGNGAGDPGLIFDVPSISLGAQFAGGSFPINIQAKSATTKSVLYNVSVLQGVTDANVTVVPSVPSFTVLGGGTQNLTVTFNLGVNAAQKDYWGQINIVSAQGGNYSLHIPYWVRVLPSPNLGTADVLLIDDDGSNSTLNADYQAYYTDALNALGVSYVVLETNWGTCASPWDIARKYKAAILFTGDGPGYLYQCDFGVGTPNLTGMNSYLAGGGRLLVTGQDAAWGLAVGDERNSDLNLYFGASYVNDNVFDGAAVPHPSAQGVGEKNPFLKDLKVDFGTVAGNQNTNDELDAVSLGDADPMPLFQAITGNNESSGMVGTRMSSEPTLERTKKTPRTLWTPLGYRTVLLSFGLESVAASPRQDLLQKFLNWLNDSLTVTLAPTTQTIVGVNKPVQLTATADSSVAGQIMYYRWDWGDGNVPAVTSGPIAYHGYAAKGTYKARVEVMDEYGHKAVSKEVTIIIK